MHIPETQIITGGWGNMHRIGLHNLYPSKIQFRQSNHSDENRYMDKKKFIKRDRRTWRTYMYVGGYH
jgi:hypothetical protein